MKLIDSIVFFPAKIMNALLLKYKKVKVGSGLRIDGGIVLYGKPEEFKIGDNCRIISCRKKNPLGGEVRRQLLLSGAMRALL